MWKNLNPRAILKLKSFKGKIPNTSYQVTQKGAKALAQYWQNIDEVRQLGKL